MKLLTFVLFSLHYVTEAVLRWISYKSPMQHIQHATSSLTSLIMDEEIVIQEEGSEEDRADRGEQRDPPHAHTHPHEETFL